MTSSLLTSVILFLLICLVICVLDAHQNFDLKDVTIAWYASWVIVRVDIFNTKLRTKFVATKIINKNLSICTIIRSTSSVSTQLGPFLWRFVLTSHMTRDHLPDDYMTWLKQCVMDSYTCIFWHAIKHKHT